MATTQTPEIQTLANGMEYEVLGEEDFKRLSKIFPLFDAFIRCKEGKWIFPSTFVPVCENIFNMECRTTDIYVMGLAKSGTTWAQEIMWTLVHNPDLDNPEASRSHDSRIPHLELDMLLNSGKVPSLTKESELVKVVNEKAPGKFDKNFQTFSLFHAAEDPRIIKSHLPICFLPEKALEISKIIYVIRDPRDVILSKFDYTRKWIVFNYQGTLDDFIDSYTSDEQFTHPSWMNIKSYFDLRDHPNVLLVFYEDLKADPFKEISKMVNFLDLKRTPEQIQNVVDYTSFRNMKKRSDEGTMDQPGTDGGRFVNKDVDGYAGFFRQGTSGGWKNKYTEKQLEKISAWMNKNLALFPEDFKYQNVN